MRLPCGTHAGDRVPAPAALLEGAARDGHLRRERRQVVAHGAARDPHVEARAAVEQRHRAADDPTGRPEQDNTFLFGFLGKKAGSPPKKKRSSTLK